MTNEIAKQEPKPLEGDILPPCNCRAPEVNGHTLDCTLKSMIGRRITIQLKVPK